MLKPLLFLCLLAAIQTKAQTVKSYTSPSDYTAGRYSVPPGIKIKRERIHNTSPDHVYQVTPIHYKKTRQVQSYWGFERNDSLFINCNWAFRTWERNKLAKAQSGRRIHIPAGTFAYARFKLARYLYFKAGRANLPGVPPPIKREDEPVVMEMLNGDVETDVQQSFHYLYDLTKDETIYFDRAAMRTFVSTLPPGEDPELVKYVNALIAAEE